MRFKTVVLAGIASVGFLGAVPAVAQTTGGNNTVTASPAAFVLSDLLDQVTNSTSNSTANSTADSFNQTNGNNTIVASQSLSAVNSNSNMDHLVDMNGGQLLGLGGAVDYASGYNRVGGNAYAAFAGISSSAWNTGLNSNAQAASNIGAQGSITFSN